MIAWGQREYSCDRGPDNCIHKNTWYLPDTEYLPERSRPLDSSDHLFLLFNILFGCFNYFHLRSFVILVIFRVVCSISQTYTSHRIKISRHFGWTQTNQSYLFKLFMNLWVLLQWPFHADFNLNCISNMQQSVTASQRRMWNTLHVLLRSNNSTVSRASQAEIRLRTVSSYRVNGHRFNRTFTAACFCESRWMGLKSLC